MASTRNVKKVQLQKEEKALTPQPQKGRKSVRGPRSEPPAKKKMMDAVEHIDEEIIFEGPEATKLFAASNSDSENMASAQVPIAKVGQKRKSTRGQVSTPQGKKSEMPGNNTQTTKSSRQMKQMNGQERTPGQNVEAHTAKFNNQKNTPLIKGQTPIQKTPKDTPGVQEDLNQTPRLKQTPKSKPEVQDKELSDGEEGDEDEEEIQQPVKGSNQKQASATKVQTPLQTHKNYPADTPGQQKGIKQTPQGRFVVKSEEESSEKEDEEGSDEEEDSESEEEEEEEEKKPMVGNKRKLPQQKVQPPKMAAKETIPKAGQKRKCSETTPVEDTKTKLAFGEPQVTGDAEENRRTLFVGNIMDSITEEDLKKLSPDIIDVRLRWRPHKKKREVKLKYFAYLVFKSEAIAEKNYKILKDFKFKSSVIRVDYVGDKRQHGKEKQRETERETEFNKTRLFISGLKTSTSESDIRKMFPTASAIYIPRPSLSQQHYGFGFVQFSNEVLAKVAKEKVQGKFRVEFARIKSESKTQDKKINPKKHESDDDEEDDDEEEDEEDDDDEEEEDEEEEGEEEDDEEEEDEEDEEEGEEEDDDDEEVEDDNV